MSATPQPHPCPWCGKPVQDDDSRCPRCGGPQPSAEALPSEQLRNPYAPFPYNGYIVWQIRTLDSREFHFYLSDRLVEVIAFSDDFWREAVRRLVPEGTSAMPFVWGLFEVAQGHEEVMRVVEQNKRYPATFEIRRVRHPEAQRLASVTLEQLLQEARALDLTAAELRFT